MKEAHRLRSVIMPGVVTMTLMLILTSLIVSISLYIEYRRYLDVYHVAQTNEINDIKHKESVLLKELTKVLKLTGSRIEAAEGNLERLQKIITSLTYLTINQVPVAFQTVSYHQISEPKGVITRLGVRDSDRIYSPSELSQKEKITFWKENFLLGRLPVSKHGVVDGVLKVRIYHPTLRAYFGSPSKIKYFVTDGAIKFESKASIGFREFVNQNRHQFTILGGVTFALVMLLAWGIVMTLRVTRKRYFQQVQNLEEALTLSAQEAGELKEDLNESEQTMKSLQVSRQSHIKLEGAIRMRQKQRATWITQSLDVVSQSYQNPKIYLPEQDQFDIIHECQKVAQSLSLGLGKSLEKEKVDLKQIILCTLLLFKEKTHKSNISVDINLPENACTIKSDALLMEVLFMDVLGKAIHRVPKNGVVSISLKEDENSFHLETLDNGYTNTGSTDKLIKKSFDLFFSNDNFQDICRENGLSFSSKKETNGLNTSCLILPFQEEEVQNNNVVRLFKN
ncbi:MAG: hypothetical protein K2Y18_08250 [Alphaproteobacteria bacterium]|jgi:hypothetical protein|nr:hypothetical protein [Alphaproteobacteria bacterium]